MKTKLNLLSFLLPLFDVEGEGGGGVQADPSPSAEPTGNVDSPATLAGEPSVNSPASVTGTEEPATTTEADPLEGLPTLAELKEQAAQKVPYAAGLANVVEAYERIKGQHKPFESWKETVEKIGDPTEAQTSYDLIRKLHSPLIENGQEVQGRYTTVPFIQDLQTQSPDAPIQLFQDLLHFPVDIGDGKQDTLLRELYRAHGLDPDRLEDYRNIDALGVASGVVSPEDLAQIDPKHHEAFKSYPAKNRQDILSLLQGDDEAKSTAVEYLADRQERLDAKKFREEFDANQKAEQETKRVERERQVFTKQVDAIKQGTERVHNSIKQNLASQWKPSTDQGECDKQYSNVLAKCYITLDPDSRFLVSSELDALGITPDLANIDLLRNQYARETDDAIRYQEEGNLLLARTKLSEANKSEQRLLAKFNAIALKFAGATPVQSGQIEMPAARQIPNGNGLQPEGSSNPFDANPHPLGSPEFAAFNRRIEKQYGASGAVF